MNKIHSFFCGNFVALDMLSYQYEKYFLKLIGGKYMNYEYLKAINEYLKQDKEKKSDEFEIIENGDE